MMITLRWAVTSTSSDGVASVRSSLDASWVSQICQIR